MKPVFLFFAILLFNIFAQAQDQKSNLESKTRAGSSAARERMASELFPDLKDRRTRSNIEEMLIETHIRPGSMKDRGSRQLKLDFEEKKRHATELMEGTGTRGGGSGIRTIRGQGKFTVQLMDIYRSENLDQYPRFFAIDPLLKTASVDLSPEQAEQKVFALILSRLEKVTPLLAAKIGFMLKLMPFEEWTPTSSSLPLIEDYIGQPQVNETQEHVQIAYRRHNQIIYNEVFYREMDGLNRAALKLHEYLYALSGNLQSAEIQRMVSLILSDRFLNFQNRQAFLSLAFELGAFYQIEKNLYLPPNTQRTSEKPGQNEKCGGLLELNSSINIPTLDVSKTNLRLDFPEGASVLELNEVGEESYLTSVASSTAYLLARYPTFLYPKRALLQQQVCIDVSTKKISSIEMTLVTSPALNELEFESARLEAMYYREQTSGGPRAAQGKLKVHNSKAREFIQHLKVNGDVKVLETVRVRLFP